MDKDQEVIIEEIWLRKGSKRTLRLRRANGIITDIYEEDDENAPAITIYGHYDTPS